MSTAEAQDGSAPGRSPGSPPTKARPAPSSAAFAAGFELRVAALLTVVAAAVAGLVAPGLRGNVTGAAVEACDRLSATLAYASALLLLVLSAQGSAAIVRQRSVSGLVRMAVIVAASFVTALGLLAFRVRLPPIGGIAIAFLATVLNLVAGATALRAVHTRALGLVLLALGAAGAVRLAGWQIAFMAGERGSLLLYSLGRGFATAGVLFEGIAQIIGAMWLGRRGRLVGQGLASLAIAGAFLITWGAAQGASSGAQLWQSMMRTALMDVPGIPAPYGLGAVATFLVPAAVLLSLVAAVQPGHLPALVSVLALALVSRGAFDVPLRALAAAVAAQWAVLLAADPSSMWKTLTTEPRAGAADAGPR